MTDMQIELPGDGTNNDAFFGTYDGFGAGPQGLPVACTGFTESTATFEIEGNTIVYSADTDDIALSTPGQDIRPYGWLRVDPPAPAQLRRDALYNQAAQHDSRAATFETMGQAAETAREGAVGSTKNDGERGAMLAAVFSFLLAIYHRNKAKELREEADGITGP